MKEFKDGLWYFAHPYTGYGENSHLIMEANFKLCVHRTARLIEMGYAVFSPIAHSHPIETASPSILGLPPLERHSLLMQLDFMIIDNTYFTGVIFAPGWNNSKGCKMEYDRFVEQNKPILFYDRIVLLV